LKLKRILVVTLVSLTFGVNVSHATGYPVVDFTQLMQLLRDAKQATEQFQKSVDSWRDQANANINGQGGIVDSINNAAANQIARTNSAIAGNYNNELKQQMQSSQDACSSYAVSTALNEATCSLLGGIYSDSTARTNTFLNKDTGFTSATDATTNNTHQLIQNAIALNQGQLSPSGGKDDSLSPMVIRADLVLGSQGDTYDKSMVTASKTFNDLLVGTKVDTAPSLKNASTQYQYVQYLRKQAFRSLAANSLDTVRQTRMPPDGDVKKPSEMQLMQKFVDDRYGTPDGDDWLKNLTNTQKDKKGTFVSDSSVIRSIAQMDAFQNYLQMKMYQSQLRQEELNAAMLTLETQQTLGN
jgi:hypothetical protein